MAKKKQRKGGAKLTDKEWKARFKICPECKWEFLQKCDTQQFCSPHCRRAGYDFALGIKRVGSCIICSESRFCCLDYHHRDPTQKSFEIGKSAGHTTTEAKAEMDKCDLLCKNCHAVVHYTNANKGLTSGILGIE